MRLWKLPLAQAGGLVGVTTEIRAERGFMQSFRNRYVSRRAICDVRIKNHQRFDAPSVEIANQAPQRGRFVLRRTVDRLDEIDRSADFCVDPMSERVNLGALRSTDQNQASAPMRDQVAVQRAHEALGSRCEFWLRETRAECIGERDR